MTLFQSATLTHSEDAVREVSVERHDHDTQCGNDLSSPAAPSVGYFFFPHYSLKIFHCVMARFLTVSFSVLALMVG